MIPREYTSRVWLLALSAISIGITLSVLKIPDWTSFARSGAFVTIIGIWTAFRQVIDARTRYTIAKFLQHFGHALIEARRGNDPESHKEHLRNAHEDRVNDFVEKYVTEYSLKLGFHEALLLIIGTLIWGFGDLINLL